MSRIRAKHTKPEKLLRSALWAAGLRYRLHFKTPFGRPDIVFPGRKVAVFVDGCFWHGCPDHYVRPRSRDEFWAAKLRENVERDRRQTAALELSGWRVVRIWEHQVLEGAPSIVDIINSALYASSWNPSRALRVIEVRPVEATNVELWNFIDLRQSGNFKSQLRRRLVRRA
ncbi:very short patch repair endonuclease [Bradyrhizobium sp. HKCCYLRH1065]|uniref:very short patch repair endonuclease n=1 Tax=unclassified Bradyrhizobium TaxID=2631580 RepID=UPI003EBC293C